MVSLLKSFYQNVSANCDEFIEAHTSLLLSAGKEKIASYAHNPRILVTKIDKIKKKMNECSFF